VRRRKFPRGFRRKRFEREVPAEIRRLAKQEGAPLPSKYLGAVLSQGEGQNDE